LALVPIIRGRGKSDPINRSGFGRQGVFREIKCVRHPLYNPTPSPNGGVTRRCPPIKADMPWSLKMDLNLAWIHT